MIPGTRVIVTSSKSYLYGRTGTVSNGINLPFGFGLVGVHLDGDHPLDILAFDESEIEEL